MVKSRHKKLGAVTEPPPTTDQTGYIDATGGPPDVEMTLADNLLLFQAPANVSHPPAQEEEKDVRMDDPSQSSYDMPAPRPQAPPPAELPSVTTPLEEHLTRTGVSRNDPGARLVRGLAETQNSAAASSRTRSRSRQEREENLVAHLAVDNCLDDLFKDYEECQAFFADRAPRPDAAAFKAALDKGAKKKSLEKRGKLLIYDRLGAAHQKLLDESRFKEWDNYLKFGAVKIISEKEAMDLVDSGSEELPTQWIETDKNEYMRSEACAEEIEPNMKSRLVARGGLSQMINRSDSPTAEKEGVFLVFSWCASRSL